MERRIAVFASGRGTNFEAIVTAAEQGEIPARVVLVVVDKPEAEVVERAARHGVPCFAFRAKEYASKADYEREIVARCEEAGVELICLAGYMRLVGDTLLEGYGGRIINIHPSLLPAFRGARAMEQALEAGVMVFGVTIAAKLVPRPLAKTAMRRSTSTVCFSGYQHPPYRLRGQ